MTASIPTPKPVAIRQILFDQGFGTRRDCEGLVSAGLVSAGWVSTGLGSTNPRVIDDAHEPFVVDGLHLVVNGQPWHCHTQALVVLHKPAGYECSQRPKSWPSVLTLLPPPLRRRGLQPVGRLDQDTTGLLLLTDDGALIHRLTSPKHHVPKVYEITCDRAIEPEQLRQLLHGVVLHDDPLPVRAEGCELTDEKTLRMTLIQGKYHQVKRMVAATGNHVVGLHRSRYGVLDLAADLAPGQWRWVEGLAAIQPPVEAPAATAPVGAQATTQATTQATAKTSASTAANT